MKLTPEKLAELQSANLPRFNWREWLVPKNEGDTHEKILGNDVTVLDKYFSHFVADPNKIGCICCGLRQGGNPVEYALGLAHFKWGIIHGEGNCDNCGYPARGIHYNVGPFERLELILQYHPDDVKLPKPSTVSST